MKTAIGLFIVCVGLFAVPHGAHACEPRKAEQCERYWITRAEWYRAKALGGYSDPLTALGNLISGAATARDIQRPINDYNEAEEWLPGGKFLDPAGKLRPEWRERFGLPGAAR